MITLSKLRGFHAIAALGSFGKAAQQLGRTQPALTAQIADLEATLGVRLFDRSTRNIKLTNEGNRFLKRTRHALAEIDSAVSEIEELVTFQRGSVAMGCIPTIAVTIFPDVLAEYSRQYPAITIEYHDEPTRILVEKLKRREIDFYVGPLPHNESDIRFDALYTDRFVVVATQFHPFAESNEHVCLDAILNEPQIGMSVGTNVRTVLDNYFTRLDLAYVPILEAKHHHTLGGIVQAGLGVTLLPLRALPLLSHHNLVWREISDHQIERDIGIGRNRGYYLAPAAEAFIDMITAGLQA